MTLRALLTLAAASAVSAPCLAQGQQTQRQIQNQYQQNQQSRHQSPQQQNQRYRADWESTTVIGYDLDADGISDVYYAVSDYELERIRQQARQRQAQRQGQQGQMRQTSRQERQQQMMQQGRQQQMQQQRQRPQVTNQRTQQRQMQQQQQADQPKTIQGTVQQMRRFTLAGMQEPTTFARVETQDGKRVIVNLGPASALRTIDLSEGDQLTARVTKGTVNNRQVLVADRIRIGDQTHRLQQPKTEDLKRISGEVTSTRTGNLRTQQGQGEQHLIARIRDQEGRAYVVCLGPTSQISKGDVQQSDQVAVLAKPANINNRHIYMAKRVSLNGNDARSIRQMGYDRGQQQQRQQSQSQRGGN